MGSDSTVINVCGCTRGDPSARVQELCSLKKTLMDWGMEERVAKSLAVRLIYGGNLLLSTAFEPQKPQSEQ